MRVRIKEIDTLYACGIIFVLVGHSHSSDWSFFEGTVLYWLIRFIYTFHMPLFFFIAGFLFLNSCSFEKKGIAKWIKDKAIRLLVPYIFWSLLALVPKYYVEHQGINGFTAGYVLKVLIYPRSGVWGHFWFLPSLFFVYLVFAVWRFFINEKNKKILVLGALLCALIIYFLPIKTDIIGLSDIKSTLVFFALGMNVRLLVDKQKKTYLKPYLLIVWGIIAIIVSAFLIDYAYSNVIIGLLVALLMLSACGCLACLLPDSKAIQWISNHNYTIYLFSWFFQAMVMMLCDKLQFHWILTFVLMLCSGIIGPIVLILAYEKIKILHNKPIKIVIGVRD